MHTNWGKGQVFSTHNMKAFKGRKIMALLILDLCTKRTLVVKLTPLSLYPPQKNPVTHWTWRWKGPRAGLDVMVKIFVAFTGIWTPDRRVRSLVAIPTKLLQITAYDLRKNSIRNLSRITARNISAGFLCPCRHNPRLYLSRNYDSIFHPCTTFQNSLLTTFQPLIQSCII